MHNILSLLKKIVRSSPPAVLLGKSVMKICSKFAGDKVCQSAISINFIEIALRHGCKFAAYFQNTLS